MIHDDAHHFQQPLLVVAVAFLTLSTMTFSLTVPENMFIIIEISRIGKMSGYD